MAEQNKTTRWHVIVSGQVQHVGFRYSACYLARGLCLTGWVDNLPDGRAELEVQGPAALLHRLLLQLKSRPYVRITELEIREIEPLPCDRAFEIRDCGET